jgi:two-component system, OmpR family, sensor kinase
VSSLRVRIPLLAVSVLALTIAALVVLASVLLGSARAAEVDRTLEAHHARFHEAVGTIARGLADAAGENQVTEPHVRQAVTTYLGSSATEGAVLVVNLGPDRFIGETAAPLLRDLRARGVLPEPDTANGSETLNTELGPARALSRPLLLRGQQIGVLRALAPLDPTGSLSEARGAMVAAAVIALLLGAAVLAVLLYRRLTPLARVSVAARRIDLTDPSVRLPEPDRADEAGRLASQLNRLLERLEAEATGRREFLGAASHELRTPITIARGHIEVLARQAKHDPEATAATARIVGEELLRLGRLVDDLLAVARSESDDFVVPRPVAVGPFFEDLRLRLNGLSLERVELEPPPEATVHADPNRLAQALLNLVLNASVHTPPDTRIEIGARRTRDGVAFFVRDDGPGIDPELRQRVLQPFVKGAGEHDSSGLGLAVVSAIVEAHGAHMALDSGPAGTTVTIELPAAPVEPVQATQEAEPGR